jgi:hypothetical protein
VGAVPVANTRPSSFLYTLFGSVLILLVMIGLYLSVAGYQHDRQLHQLQTSRLPARMIRQIRFQLTHGQLQGIAGGYTCATCATVEVSA